MTGAHQKLRDYYEHEAAMKHRLGQPLRAGRVELRAAFVELLADEGLRSVVDFGAGPGRDGQAFAAAGFDYLGVDLAVGNARLAAEGALVVVPGSITELPLRPRCFDAGWSFSTLMHLDEVDAGRALDEIVRVLQPGAPMVIGMWGLEGSTSMIEQADMEGNRVRPFHLRSLAVNRALVAGRGNVEQIDRWEGSGATGNWDYQVFWLRLPV